MSDFNTNRPADEDDIARVLQAAGRRVEPPAGVADQVRAAVHAEWREAVAERQLQRQQQRRRLAIGAALAAAASIAAVAVWFNQPLTSSPAAIVASVDRISGTVTAAGPDIESPGLVTERQELRVGQQLTTGHDSRAALRLGAGVSVRLDHDTQITLAAADRLAVTSGAIYVDTGAAHAAPAGATSLQIETPVGLVRHLGTQYEVRLLPAAVRVAVREGRVQIDPRSGSNVQSRAGEQLLLTTDGRIQRQNIAPDEAAWDWTGEIAPWFAIDNRPLPEFLDWVSRELGQPIVFASPQSQAEAARFILRGSVAGLTPDAALEAVLSTTSLRSVERDGQIVLQQLDGAAGGSAPQQ